MARADAYHWHEYAWHHHGGDVGLRGSHRLELALQRLEDDARAAHIEAVLQRKAVGHVLQIVPCRGRRAKVRAVSMTL